LLRLGPTSEARRAKAPTTRERAYLDAVEILYGDGPKARRDTAYSRAMERLVARFAADREAQVFYAASLLGLSQGVRNVPTYMRAAAIVGRVFRDNPDHPGAAHLLIHCYDDPIHAPLGLAAARAYSKIAPDAAHAQHMTTHIFLALGMWDDVVSQNELASGHDPATCAPVPAGQDRDPVPDILEKELRALLREADGARGDAVTLLREATALEDAMPVEFGPPADVKPAHELLGEILLQAGRPREAQREFARQLQLAPKRALSLRGLGRAAAAAGDATTAARAYGELRAIWHRADADRPELAEAARFL